MFIQDTLTRSVSSVLLSPDATTNEKIKDIVGMMMLLNDAWIGVHNELPEPLETVWISNGKGFTTLGCRSDLYDNGAGGYDWCWCAVVNGVIYEEEGRIVAECEEDDIDVKYWKPLPKPINEK